MAAKILRDQLDKRAMSIKIFSPAVLAANTAVYLSTKMAATVFFINFGFCLHLNFPRENLSHPLSM